MYTDNAEATYILGRVRSSREMAEKAFDKRAALAHEQLAYCYMARLAELQRPVAAPRIFDGDHRIRAIARPPEFHLAGTGLTLVAG